MRATFALLAFAALPAPTPSRAPQRGSALDFAVVVNATVPVDDLTLDEVRRIFTLGRRFWQAGRPVLVLLPGEGLPGRRVLLDQVCHLSDAQHRRLILERLYQGEIDAPPKFAGTERETVAFVGATPGMIGIVTAGGPLDAEVKVLRIDGKKPGDPGYPLRRQ